jgi:hypothetical protein
MDAAFDGTLLFFNSPPSSPLYPLFGADIDEACAQQPMHRAGSADDDDSSEFNALPRGSHQSAPQLAGVGSLPPPSSPCQSSSALHSCLAPPSDEETQLLCMLHDSEAQLAFLTASECMATCRPRRAPMCMRAPMGRASAAPCCACLRRAAPACAAACPASLC